MFAISDALYNVFSIYIVNELTDMIVSIQADGSKKMRYLIK